MIISYGVSSIAISSYIFYPFEMKFSGYFEKAYTTLCTHPDFQIFHQGGFSIVKCSEFTKFGTFEDAEAALVKNLKIRMRT